MESLAPLQLDRSYLVGERLAHFKENWRRFTSDQWILHIVEHGVLIDFHTWPTLTDSPVFIERVVDETSWGLYSRFFVVPK